MVTSLVRTDSSGIMG